MTSPLQTRLEGVEWGEFRIGDLFTSSNGDTDIKKQDINGLGIPVITAGVTNYGILGKSNIVAKVFPAETVTVDMFGNVHYRPFSYKLVTHARVFSLTPVKNVMGNVLRFMLPSIEKITKGYSYENMCSWIKIKNKSIKLPAKKGEIDFAFMEQFIVAVEEETRDGIFEYVDRAEQYYLANPLTPEDREVLETMTMGRVHWETFRIGDLFDNIVQGRRLRKEDQLPGDIPFVMSGTTRTGIVNHISNPVAVFEKNAITIDIFGNAFYRDYRFGAGDDTGVYFSTSVDYTPETMRFFTICITKCLSGKHEYGNKLRSSRSKHYKIKLPVKNGEIDFAFMEQFMVAVEKAVMYDICEELNKVKTILLASTTG